MKAILHLALALAVLTLLFAAPSLHASPGDLDPLDANLVGNYVLATAVQPDGKIIIGGNFTSVLGVPRSNLARLNAGWLCVPMPEADSSGVGSSKDMIGGHSSTEAALVCVPSAVDDEGVRVQLAPGGPWRAQRAQGGSAGWVCWMHMHMPTARLQPLSTCPLHAFSP